jgi:hypothetical protein
LVGRSQKTAAEIIDGCGDRLPDYMVPSQIYRVANWPLNGNGKTDYTSLTGLLRNADVELQ